MRFFTPEEDAKIAREYRAGKMIRLIALDIGRSTSSVKTRLQRIGVPFNRNNPKARKEIRIKVPHDVLAKIDRAARYSETTRSRYVVVVLRRAIEAL